MSSTLPKSYVDNQDLQAIVEGMLTYLSNKEQEIIKLRYGLIDGESKTFKQIASKLNLTRQRIRQIERKSN